LFTLLSLEQGQCIHTYDGYSHFVYFYNGLPSLDRQRFTFCQGKWVIIWENISAKAATSLHLFWKIDFLRVRGRCSLSASQLIVRGGGGRWAVGGVQWVVVFQPRFLDTLPLPERYFSFACCVQLIPLPKWIATESLAHTRQDVVFGGRNPKGHAKTTSAIWRKRVVPCGRRDMNIDHPLSQRTFCKPTHLDLVYWIRVPWNTPIDCSLMSPVN